VAVVRRELEEAGALDTVDGQLALLLAASVASTTGTGLVQISAELRAAMARAVPPPPAPEDDVQRARRRRAATFAAAQGLAPDPDDDDGGEA
jgi:hypothetical protein